MKIKKRIAKTLRFIADNLDIARSDKPLIDKEVHISKTFTRAIKRPPNIRKHTSNLNDIEIVGISVKDIYENTQISDNILLSIVNSECGNISEYIKFYLDRYTDTIVLGVVRNDAVSFPLPNNIIHNILEYLYSTYPLTTASIDNMLNCLTETANTYAIIIGPKGRIHTIFIDSIRPLDSTTCIPSEIYLHESACLELSALSIHQLVERYVEIDIGLSKRAIVKNCSFK